MSKDKDNIDNLLMAAARVLYKFSEGEEDWTEWSDLCKYLRLVASKSSDTYVRRRVADTCEEFIDRRNEL